MPATRGTTNAGAGVSFVVPGDDQVTKLDERDLPRLLEQTPCDPSPAGGKRIRYATENWGPEKDIHFEVEMGRRIAFIDISEDEVNVVAETGDRAEALVLAGNAAVIRFIKPALAG